MTVAAPCAIPPAERELHALEAAAFAAWPCLEEARLEGWRLRFASGYTKRANSANATIEAGPLDATGIEAVERHYAARGLPAIFRLVSFSPAAATDSALEARGYALVDRSLVMTAPLGAHPEALDAAAGTVTLAPKAEPWLRAYQSVSGQLGPGQATHLAMLRAIDGRPAFALDAAGGDSGAAGAACVGLGVLHGGRLGLFDVATRPEARGQGRATRLCAGLMAWGRDAGATGAFLQVVAGNARAIALYERLGFRVAYEYWYRVQPAPTGG
jgi:ribosomal protein S18 acetylase RimI-like enzyme